MSLTRIYQASDTHMAHLLQAILENEGISAHVTSQGISEVALAYVWVDEHDIARAQPLINKLERASSKARASSWTCPNCGEEVDGDFAICWNCQEPREPSSSEPSRAPADSAIQTDIACIRCGYDLRGLAPAGRCPECGTKILHTIFDRLQAGVVPDDEHLQSVLYNSFRPVYRATGTPGTVLCLICHAWLRATEPVDPQGPVAQTPSDAAWLTCNAVGQLSLNSFGTPGAAIAGLSKSGITAPADIGTKLAALMEANLLDNPGYDVRPIFTPLPALIRFISRDQ